MYSYRKGTAADFPQLKQLGILSYGKFSSVLTPDNFSIMDKNLRGDVMWEQLMKTSTSFVCETENKIVGMAFLILSGNPNDIFEKDWSYIRMVGVDPAHGGVGIAKQLTKNCIEEAKARGEKIIALHTSEFMDAARHIYESLGFTIMKEIPPRFGKKYWLYSLDL